jgi:nitrite transporter NirC
LSYLEHCDHFADLAAKKARMLGRAPGAFAISALLGGAYIGIALILALTVSSGLPAGARPLVSGGVFGIGLLLVQFAGADLFTGTVMYAVLGLARGRLSLAKALALMAAVWIGNLAGAAILAWIFSTGGGGAVFSAPPPFLHDYVAHKVDAAPLTLVARASLCNWLVCLAIWMHARLQSDSARIMAIGWCLLAFVACGFEHSVANMTLFTLGMLDPVPVVDAAGAVHNLFWVTIGNMGGGGVFGAGAYLAMGRGEQRAGA